MRMEDRLAGFRKQESDLAEDAHLCSWASAGVAVGGFLLGKASKSRSSSQSQESSTSTQQAVQQTPSLTPEELELQKQNLEISKAQLGVIQQQAGLQQQSFDFTKELISSAQAEQESINRILSPETRAEFERQQLEMAMELGPIQQEITKMQLEQLKQGGRATPEQIALIDKITAGAKSTGESDIDRATSMALEQLRDDFANASGLRASDSPILDRAGRIQAEAIRSKGQLSSTLESSAANAKLNFPLMSTQILSGAGAVQQGFAAQVQQFQQQLREQAFNNRLSLANQFQGTGIGFANIGGGGFGLADVMGRNRPGIRGTSLGSSSSSGFSFGSSRGAADLQGLGALASGIGAMMAASDRRLKRNIKYIGQHPGGYNLYSFEYLDGQKSIGVMADEVAITNPSAVHIIDGYKYVDYGKL